MKSKMVFPLLVLMTTLITLSRPDLILLDTAEGQKMLSPCFKGGFFCPFISIALHWEAQITPTFCAIASAVSVLNALHVPRPAISGVPAYFYQQTFFSLPFVSEVVSEPSVRKGGMSLRDFAKVLRIFDPDHITVDVSFASRQTVEQFRDNLKGCLQGRNTFMVVNYLRSALGQKGNGHFSPIGAYNSESDHVLIMDVSKYKYPPAWVKVDTLFAAMADPERGYLQITRQHDTGLASNV